ncbi:HupE / UreJ protein [Noviherbaspirillum humi]|uniref:HupE / UreJ protein n=1 Tax=Noviherbaspirillum humi TaxID=1688639 RepID=A0A239DV53_9BURK|nr:HupE/UreJ family protein [Noviherbaspirillum humi]SNS36340.1 HupE / UreJ protein [Noviherbaspirillum humi]
MRWQVALLWLAACLLANPAQAHKPSDSYLALAVDGRAVNGQWDIALRDLDFAIGLDANGDAAITWGEVKAKHAEIDAYALARLRLGSDGADCPTQVTDHLIDDHTDGAYAVIRFRADCPAPVGVLEATYRLFFDIDPQHKGLLRLEYGGAASTAVFTPEKASQRFTLEKPSALGQFLDYGREGVWHIWIGFDHILFLLALLLPAVAYRQAGKWEAVAAFRPAFVSVLKIVTAFTIAHSITLSLATLKLISLPSRLVESTIAASVVAAALNNVFPLFRERRWAMAFLFGLIHGFGFASVLADLGLPQQALALALVGFNLGVEAGQLAIVAVFLPIAYLLRRTAFYRRLVLIGGSLLIAALAAVWLAERAFDLKLLTF